MPFPPAAAPPLLLVFAAGSSGELSKVTAGWECLGREITSRRAERAVGLLGERDGDGVPLVAAGLAFDRVERGVPRDIVCLCFWIQDLGERGKDEPGGRDCRVLS